MSWLYTIVFAGLMASSPGAAPLNVEPGIQAAPVALERVVGDETEKFEQTYALNSNGRVSVSNVNGSITVEAWDRSEVKLQYTKTADTKERLSDVEIRIDSRADLFVVKTDHGDWSTKQGAERWKHSGNLTVEFRLMVPRGAVLSDVETVNGSVTVSNFTNVTRVSAVNGSVNATNIRGTAKLCTVNGEVLADFDRLETGSKITLETVNGRVSLTIPSDANATLRADSLNGNITNDFGLPVRKGKYIGRDLYGKVGTGDVQIKLNSVNGPLAIGRKSDGKSVNPAVNMLPQKEKDDEDWDKDDDNDNDNDNDNDEDMSLNVAKMDKDVAKAVKATNKVTNKAMVDAQSQINKIQPELAKMTAQSLLSAADAISETAKALSSDAFNQSINKDMMASMANADLFRTVPRIESKRGSFAVKGVPKVSVEAKGCSVRVRGWDKSEVGYRVTQFADPRNRTPLAVSESHTDSSVTLKVTNAAHAPLGGNFADESRGVRIEVFVPRKSDLKINSNGEIRLEGVSGDIDLTGSDEAINVRDADGKLRVSNTDGRVRIIGFRGELDSTTTDGDVYLEGEFSRITGNTSGGNFYLTVADDPKFDLKANIDALTIENLLVPKAVTEGHWRFGAGGPKYTFTLSDGQVYVRSAATLAK
jgi:DUF4097 and DUF4098 domain-containing protein YvlB